jgi:hypothetical protein
MKDAYRKFRDGFYCGFGQQIEGKVLLPAAEYQRLVGAQKVIDALQDADGNAALDIIEKIQLAKVKP